MDQAAENLRNMDALPFSESNNQDLDYYVKKTIELLQLVKDFERCVTIETDSITFDVNKAKKHAPELAKFFKDDVQNKIKAGEVVKLAPKELRYAAKNLLDKGASLKRKMRKMKKKNRKAYEPLRGKIHSVSVQFSTAKGKLKDVVAQMNKRWKQLRKKGKDFKTQQNVAAFGEMAFGNEGGETEPAHIPSKKRKSKHEPYFMDDTGTDNTWTELFLAAQTNHRMEGHQDVREQLSFRCAEHFHSVVVHSPASDRLGRKQEAVSLSMLAVQ
ncbi:hypothetical protein DdX_11550 [Ditylenchus destructor]|uniref:Uncharacterized protein n=1 Tax=Ditylenchus destructor TaxID=166010 RepID=A0AAD4N052_9BILA|nr:hypothetical protein DdX_11550 [Ditylenchus destructor]